MKRILAIMFMALLVASMASGTEIRDDMTFTNTVTFRGEVVNTVSQQYIMSTAGCYAGATAGWVAYSSDTNSDIGHMTLPASQTSATLVCPVTVPLKIGWTMTAFSLVGQSESGGNTVTVDANLRKTTVVAAALTDASVGVITQSVTIADTAMSNASSSFTNDTVAATESFYILVTATTEAATDIDLSGFTLTVSEN